MFGMARAPGGIEPDPVAEISSALTVTLADMFALYLTTENFHWHVTGAHFRDYHLLLDEQSEQIFSTTDAMAERVRKIGGTTLRSIGHIARLQQAGLVPPRDAQGRPSLAISLSLCREVQDARSGILPRGYSRLGQITSRVIS